MAKCTHGITKQAQEGSTSLDRHICVWTWPTNFILESIFWGQQVHASPFRYNNIIIDYLITFSWKTKLYILNFERLNILIEWVGGIVVPSHQVRWTIIQPMLSTDYEPMLTFSRITQSYHVTPCISWQKSPLRLRPTSTTACFSALMEPMEPLQFAEKFRSIEIVMPWALRSVY